MWYVYSHCVNQVEFPPGTRNMTLCIISYIISVRQVILQCGVESELVYIRISMSVMLSAPGGIRCVSSVHAWSINHTLTPDVGCLRHLPSFNPLILKFCCILTFLPFLYVCLVRLTCKCHFTDSEKGNCRLPKRLKKDSF